MTKGDISCVCITKSKQQDTKCESIKTEGHLSVYKIYCAGCEEVLDIVYHGITGIPIVSVAATS